MDARVIKLEPKSNAITKVITFDEAFEEHSEARGRGRARRQRRRMERIENKAERRSARRQARSEARSERQAARSERQAGRQANRMQRKSARLERRMAGAEARAERRKLRHPDSEPLDSSNNEQGTEQNYPSPNEAPSSLPPDQVQDGYQEQGQGDITEGSNVGEGSYPTTNESQNYGSQEESGYDDSQDEEEDAEDNSPDGQEDSDDEEYGFDGVMGAEDRYVELSDNDNIQRIDVSPEMIDLANKYEWNKELVCRLIAKKSDAEKTNATPTKGIEEEIANRKNRMSEIKASFDNYLNYDCDFSQACGCGMSNADGTSFKKNGNHKRKQREHQVRRALGVAKARRNEIKTGSAATKLADKKAKMQYYGGDVTPVEAELNPQFSTNRIVVPAEKSSNFDNTNGLGYANDLDAPPTREVFLGFDGSTTRNIMIVGLAVLVGYIVYKQVKK